MLKDFNVSDYKIIKQIGQGSYGQILLVEDIHHQKYALKKIIGSSESEIKSLKQEYQILFDIQSNLNENKTDINIVNIYGLSTKKLDPTTYVMYVLMELGNMDWENEILSRQKQKQYYSEKELMNILYALVKTLAQLQKENISHRDIKPQNILVFTNNNNKCYKLADFGEAKELISGNKPTEKQTLRGTELYMSPLLFYGLRSRKIKKYIKHNPYKSDVFSLGLCTLFAATLCFESLYDVRELQNNVSIKIVIEKYLKKRYTYKLITIINSMLDINETTRDDFIELKKEIENIQN
jgi:translation initiation factor 2-alpha kinase 4